MRADDEILEEIPRWATRGVAAIRGRLIDSKNGDSDVWPNKAEIMAVIKRIDDAEERHPERRANDRLP